MTRMTGAETVILGVSCIEYSCANFRFWILDFRLGIWIAVQSKIKNRKSKIRLPSHRRQRQRESKHRSPVGVGAIDRRDASAVEFDHAFADRQAQTTAAAIVLVGLNELFKETFFLAKWNSWAVI